MVSNVELEVPRVWSWKRFSSTGERKKSVRRCLFGRPSGSENLRLLRKLSQQLSEEVTARWNFDFETSTPLPGRYDWTRTAASKVEDNGQETVSICSDSTKTTTTTNEGLCPFEVTASSPDAEVTESASSSTAESGRRTSESVESLSCNSESVRRRISSKSLSTPIRKQTNKLPKAHLKRLVWAPKKKKTGNGSRRGLRESTNITDYFPARKQSLSSVRRQLKL